MRVMVDFWKSGGDDVIETIVFGQVGEGRVRRMCFF